MSLFFNAHIPAEAGAPRELLDSFLAAGRETGVVDAGAKAAVGDIMEGKVHAEFEDSVMTLGVDQDVILWHFRPAVQSGSEALCTPLSSWIFLADVWFSQHAPLVASVHDEPMRGQHRETLWADGTMRFGPHGFNHNVASIMWLGPQFWPRTGASRTQLRAAPFLQCFESPTGVMRVQAWPHPFNDFSGRQLERYRALQGLLFPRFKPQAVQ